LTSAGGLDPKSINVGIQSFSSDARLALAWASDGIIRVWHVEEGAVHLLDRDINDGKARAQDRSGAGATFSADGRLAIAWGKGNRLGLYEVGTGKLIRQFQQAPNVCHGAWFSPDGQRVLAPYGNQDDGGLWDVQSGKEIYRLSGNPGGMSILRFSPDGRRALSAGRDGTVRLWGLPD
jgi:WD40 repeat protein